MGGGSINKLHEQLKYFVCGVHLTCTCECACWPRSGHYHPSQSCRISCTHSSHVNGIEARLCGRRRGRLEACVRTSHPFTSVTLFFIFRHKYTHTLSLSLLLTRPKYCTKTPHSVGYMRGMLTVHGPLRRMHPQGRCWLQRPWSACTFSLATV